MIVVNLPERNMRNMVLSVNKSKEKVCFILLNTIKNIVNKYRCILNNEKICKYM